MAGARGQVRGRRLPMPCRLLLVSWRCLPTIGRRRAPLPLSPLRHSLPDGRSTWPLGVGRWLVEEDAVSLVPDAR